MLTKLLALFCIIQPLYGANILGIWFHGGKSHHILGEMLLKELARRGHNVTMASPFPLKEPFPNYTDVHLTGILEDQLSREAIFMKMNEGSHAFAGLDDFLALSRSQTELALNHTEITRLLNSGTKYDVVIMDWLMNYANLIWGRLFKAPIIVITSAGTTPLSSSLVGASLPAAYIPHALLSLPSHMNFFERTLNSVVTFVGYLVGLKNIKYHNDLLQKYYKEDAPTYDELKDDIALLLSNAHYSFETPRPLFPNIIPVGGFHVQKPKKLPKDLQAFMDQSKEGVVYFSLGSNMKSTLLPTEKQQEILRALGKIPYKVLWKWENSDLEGKPDNVLIKNWFPQNDILGHPNLKLFVSHGGLLSTIESLYHGVPVLGIPIFGDQQNNILNAERAGYALHIDLPNLTEKTLYDTLNEILSNSTYADNAKTRSRLLHDQPLSPMDAAVFWVEHVIRHKGAPHLKNAGLHLTWYQHWLLDVISFISGILLVAILIVYFIVRKTISFIRRAMCKSKTD